MTSLQINNRTEYLFIGGLFPKEIEQEIIANSKGSIQNAANIFQYKIIDGIEQNLGYPVSILNAVFIGSFPRRYKKMFIKPFRFSHTKDSDDFNVGFCNLTIYKHFSRQKQMKKQVLKWIDSTKGRNRVVIGYAMTNMTLSCIEKIKKTDPSIKTCLIVPDLPQYMNVGGKKTALYSMLKSHDIKELRKKNKFVDLFVLLTEQMHDNLAVNNYVVVEGIASHNVATEKKAYTKEKKILYTGGLSNSYGLKELVDAFRLTKNLDYRLIICGAGQAESYIKEAASKDTRIIYKGQLPHSEIIKLQNQATVLVNPRKNNFEFTKYSFPSKILEYLSSGTPVIAYKLDGIPDEYDSYIIYVKNDTNEELAKTIDKICSLSFEEQVRLGSAAKEFVLNCKNGRVQTKKILDAINNI